MTARDKGRTAVHGAVSASATTAGRVERHSEAHRSGHTASSMHGRVDEAEEQMIALDVLLAGLTNL